MNVFGVGPTEILVVLIIVLVLFGPERLPELAKKIGGASREIRENLNTLNNQMNSALETSMELDKARMIPPTDAPPAPPAPASTESNLDSPAPNAEEPSLLPPAPTDAREEIPPTSNA
jgi:Tat protein translocase TatB subunit